MYIKKKFLLLLSFILLFTNAAYAQNLNAYVDRSEPELTIVKYHVDDKILVVNGTAYDRYSGVKSVTVSAEGGKFVEADSYEKGEGGEWIYKYRIPDNPKKYGTFTFRAEDVVGNVAEITRSDIEIYNLEARLIFPNAIGKNTTVVPQIEGEPVKAVVTISGNGYDFIEYELIGPSFALSWDGKFNGKDAAPGHYLASVTTYNPVGHYTISNTQIIILPNPTPTPTPTNTPTPTKTPAATATKTPAVTPTPRFTATPTLTPTPTVDPKERDRERYRDVDINGYVDSVSADRIFVNGQEYRVNEETGLDESIKPGSKVTGLGKYDITTGLTEVSVLRKLEDKKYNIPEIEIKTDEKIGETEFSGIVEAIGEDYIIVSGKIINITDATEMNTDFSEIKPGDFISGISEIFSESGEKAAIINKAIVEKSVKKNTVGHIVEINNSQIKIDTINETMNITDVTALNGDLKPGDIVYVEYIDPSFDAMTVNSIQSAQCNSDMTYYYGEVRGIFENSGEIVIGDYIYKTDAETRYDTDIAKIETGSYAAIVDVNCAVKAIRVVQNSGATLNEDRVIGTITDFGEKDIAGNIPVYIDKNYYFATDKTTIYPELRTGMLVTAAKTGNELIHVAEVPDASINVDDLTDFVGTVARISAPDNHGNYYLTVNGVAYRVTDSSVIDQSVGKFQRGAIVSGTTINNDLIHAAVIKERSEDINPNNAFIGRIVNRERVSPEEYRLLIDDKGYKLDTDTMIYADIDIGNTLIGVHDGGQLLAIRDYPSTLSSDRPKVLLGLIDNVSAKNSSGEFTMTVNGEDYYVDASVQQSGYISRSIPCMLLYLQDETGTQKKLKAVYAAAGMNLAQQLRAGTGKIGSIGLSDDNGNGVIYIDGFAYSYSANTLMPPLNDEDNIIFAVSGHEIAAAAKIDQDMIYAAPALFSDEIRSISDLQTDGSYVITLEDGMRISLTKDTLLNDANADIEPGVVISGVHFDGRVYVAAVYGSGLIDVRDAAFSGVLEDVIIDPDGIVRKIMINHREFNANYSGTDADDFIQGKIVAGSVRPGKDVVSMMIVSPDVADGEVTSLGGYIESISATDNTGSRQVVIDSEVYNIPATAQTHGNLVDGARVSMFYMKHSGKVISIAAVESFDQGSPFSGKISEITSDRVSAPNQPEWKHISLGGINNLMSDDTVELNGEVLVNDTVHGYLFGEEREILAIVKEDNTVIGKFKRSTTAVKTGVAGLFTAIAGAAAAIGIGKKKKKNSLGQ